METEASVNKNLGASAAAMDHRLTVIERFGHSSEQTAAPTQVQTLMALALEPSTEREGLLSPKLEALL